MSDTELLRDLIGALDKKLSGRLNHQDDTLGRIETQVRATNGRVTKIEQERAAERAVRMDNQERRVRREDYERGPRIQNRIAGTALVLAVLLPVALKFF